MRGCGRNRLQQVLALCDPQLQQLALPAQGLLANLLSFNVGVEMGQILALGGVVVALTWWRTRPGYLRHAFITNTALMAGGFVLLGYQLVGYLVNPS